MYNLKSFTWDLLPSYSEHSADRVRFSASNSGLDTSPRDAAMVSGRAAATLSWNGIFFSWNVHIKHSKTWQLRKKQFLVDPRCWCVVRDFIRHHECWVNPFKSDRIFCQHSERQVAMMILNLFTQQTRHCLHNWRPSINPLLSGGSPNLTRIFCKGFLSKSGLQCCSSPTSKVL